MSALSDLFALFVSENKARPSLLSPFEVNGKVYATNGHTMIRCDKMHCDFEITNKERLFDNLLFIESFIPIVNNNLTLDIDKSLFDSYEKVDEEIDIGEDIECDLCDGTGEVEWEFDIHTKTDACPVCGGDGKEAVAKFVKTGKKTYKDLKIKLGDAYFNADNFYKLIQVSDALSGDIILLSQISPTSGNLFRIGFCEILLMPIRMTRVDSSDSILTIDLSK